MKATITELETLSVPKELCREMHLETGQTVLWEKVSATEIRMIVLPSVPALTDPTHGADPMAAIGFGYRHGLVETPHASSDDYMREIRGDDYVTEEGR